MTGDGKAPPRPGPRVAGPPVPGPPRHPARPRPPIDSRIRARRVAVAREEGRRRLRILVVVAAVLALGGSGVALTRSSVLDVDHIEVTGVERTTRAEVVAAGRLAGGPLMVSIDTATVARRVESLPWVLDARATRRWPATVRVEVTERRPLAVVAVGTGGRWAVVDASGRVLVIQRDRPPALVALGGLARPGPTGSALGPAAHALLAVVVALPEGLADRVTEAAIASSGVELVLADPPGAVVRLGDSDDLAAKLQALRTIMDRAAASVGTDEAPLGDVAIVDVRVPSSPVLTRR